MSTEILVDTVTTTTDSCQMVATETTLQVTAATKSDNQTTANEAYTAVPPRRTFNETVCIFNRRLCRGVHCSARYRTDYQNANATSFLKEALTTNKKNKSPK